MIKIHNCTHDEKSEIIKLAVETFSRGDDQEVIKELMYSDWNNSFSAVVDNTVVGVYLIDTSYANVYQMYRSDQNKDVLAQYRYLCGIRGIALAVHSKYRGQGIGRQLKTHVYNYAVENKYDYIFGGQAKWLNNLNYWLKSRRVIVEGDWGYVTVQDL